MNIFLAHRKDTDQEALQGLRNSIRAYCASGNQTARITSGVEDYQRNFKACGSWDKWIENVVIGRDPMTSEYRYDVFIVPDENIGAATAKMIQLALKHGRKFYYWAEDRPLRIVELKTIDAKNFKSGWQFVYEQ